MITPLFNYVLVKPAGSEKMSQGGIVIPDVAQKKSERGTVLAVGTGAILDDGTRGRFDVQIGDEVLFSRYGGIDVEVDGEDLLLIQQHDIPAVLKRADAPVIRLKDGVTEKEISEGLAKIQTAPQGPRQFVSCKPGEMVVVP